MFSAKHHQVAILSYSPYNFARFCLICSLVKVESQLDCPLGAANTTAFQYMLKYTAEYVDGNIWPHTLPCDSSSLTTDQKLWIWTLCNNIISRVNFQHLNYCGPFQKVQPVTPVFVLKKAISTKHKSKQKWGNSLLNNDLFHTCLRPVACVYCCAIVWLGLLDMWMPPLSECTSNIPVMCTYTVKVHEGTLCECWLTRCSLCRRWTGLWSLSPQRDWCFMSLLQSRTTWASIRWDSGLQTKLKLY